MPTSVRTASTARRWSRRSAALLMAATLTGLSACGSDDGNDDSGSDDAGSAATTTSAAPSSPAETESSSPAPTSEDAGTQSLAVTAVDFAFELDGTDLPAGEYEIELTNGGGATHDLVVERDGEDVAETEQIPPGESATTTVTLEPGEYVFYCSVGNHRSMGMEVTVTVT